MLLAFLLFTSPLFNRGKTFSSAPFITGTDEGQKWAPGQEHDKKTCLGCSVLGPCHFFWLSPAPAPKWFPVCPSNQGKNGPLVFSTPAFWNLHCTQRCPPVLFGCLATHHQIPRLFLVRIYGTSTKGFTNNILSVMEGLGQTLLLRRKKIFGGCRWLLLSSTYVCTSLVVLVVCCWTVGAAQAA